MPPKRNRRAAEAIHSQGRISAACTGSAISSGVPRPRKTKQRKIIQKNIPCKTLGRITTPGLNLINTGGQVPDKRLKKKEPWCQENARSNDESLSHTMTSERGRTPCHSSVLQGQCQSQCKVCIYPAVFRNGVHVFQSRKQLLPQICTTHTGNRRKVEQG